MQEMVGRLGDQSGERLEDPLETKGPSGCRNRKERKGRPRHSSERPVLGLCEGSEGEIRENARRQET